MKTYEYKEFGFGELKTQYGTQLDVNKLNQLGNEGWELVLIDSGQCVFKRERRKLAISEL